MPVIGPLFANGFHDKANVVEEIFRWFFWLSAIFERQNRKGSLDLIMPEIASFM